MSEVMPSGIGSSIISSHPGKILLFEHGFLISRGFGISNSNDILVHSGSSTWQQ